MKHISNVFSIYFFKFIHGTRTSFTHYLGINWHSITFIQQTLSYMRIVKQNCNFIPSTCERTDWSNNTLPQTATCCISIIESRSYKNVTYYIILCVMALYKPVYTIIKWTKIDGMFQSISSSTAQCSVYEILYKCADSFDIFVIRWYTYRYNTGWRMLNTIINNNNKTPFATDYNYLCFLFIYCLMQDCLAVSTCTPGRNFVNQTIDRKCYRATPL